jgi:serine/threonine-protein kinase
MTASARFGRFAVRARIGVGGMGEVFRARSDADGEVALKVMRPELVTDERFRRMFLAEARLCARLSHPNVVRLIEYGEVNRMPWLAMELVDGVSLDRMIRAAPLEPELAAYVARELLAALAYLHSLGLVHRDVSAVNVLVSSAGEVKLSDFGVARVGDPTTLSCAGEGKGNPSYMAPEQLRSVAGEQRIDGRADLFALGVLLYRMISGRRPFAATVEWLRCGCPLACDGPLAKVIVRAMSRSPDGRFSTAKEMACAVRAHARPARDGAARLAARACALASEERPMGAFDRLILQAVGCERLAEERTQPMP